MLEPVLVQPYRDGPKEDRFLLLEGERRYTVAKGLGLVEMPAIVTSKLDDHDQLLVMYHDHTQRKGWEMAEQLRTIKELMDRNGHVPDEDMAKELGMSAATFRNRLQVLPWSVSPHSGWLTSGSRATTTMRRRRLGPDRP